MEKNIFLKKKENNLKKALINYGILVLIILFVFIYREFLINFIKSTITIWLAYKSYFFTGIGVTVVLSLISVAAGTLIGLLVYTMRSSNSKVPKKLARVFVEIIRGTPLMVQLFIVFFGASSIINIRQTGIPTSTFAFIGGIVAVSINSGAYVSEIIRSGIQSVSKGQMEAGRSLGLSRKQTMKEIIYPQAIKNILPAIANEFITIIKETSIVSYIGVTDIMYNVNIVKGITFRPMEPLIVSAVMYFILTFTLSKVVGKYERRMQLSD